MHQLRWRLKFLPWLFYRLQLQVHLPKVRFGILSKAEEYLIREGVPIAPLFFYVGIQLYDPARLGGIEANVLDEHPLREIFRKDAIPTPKS